MVETPGSGDAPSALATPAASQQACWLRRLSLKGQRSFLRGRRSFPKGWYKRVRIWFAWVALFAAVPYIAVLFTSAAYAGHLERMTGQGQLIVTSVAVTGGMMREIWTLDDKQHWTREAIPYLVVYVVLAGILYGQIMARLVQNDGKLPLGQQHQNSIYSLIIVGITVVVALVVLVSTTPKQEVSQ